MINLAECHSLVEPLARHAAERPEQLALVFMGEDGQTVRLTTADFYQAAMAAGQTLQQAGLQEDDLVILVMRHSHQLLTTFWGALAIGAVPSIFPFLTEKLDPDIYRERVQKLVAHSEAKAVITFPEFVEPLTQLLEDVDCQVLSAADLAVSEAVQSRNGYRPSAEKIAFLQHSSGTTGLQKGVALAHRSVLNQIIAYSQAVGLEDDDVVVSWLPLYHDMGLIAGFVLPLTAGVPLVLMSPFDWVRDPKRLLWAMVEHNGTLCWLPNFAYNHMAKSIRKRDLEGLDLSGWRLAINCSEPVHHASHETFLKKFAPYGFRPEALATCYAMAENTFAVTQSVESPCVEWVDLPKLQREKIAVEITAAAPHAIPMVSCGRPISGTEVMIVDDEGNGLAERQVGEVLARGNSMLSGYYKRPELTAAAIKNGWYYTGDMGYLSGGELFITGRKKDLIIVGGKNVYPQDLEAIANRVDGIYPGRAVAFGVLNGRLGTEGIVMVCELAESAAPEQQKAIEQALRQQIVAQTEVTLNDVRFVAERWVLKTSSGKLARAANREKYVGEFGK